MEFSTLRRIAILKLAEAGLPGPRTGDLTLIEGQWG
jgi:hypothetical protein